MNVVFLVRTPDPIVFRLSQQIIDVELPTGEESVLLTQRILDDGRVGAVWVSGDVGPGSWRLTTASAPPSLPGLGGGP